ncbi:GNAT family N-acetyltransferase [Oceanobacillus sp. CAU 1775]
MNPLLIEFPEEFTTERLIIRAPKPGDGKAIHEAMMASIKELKPWMAFAQSEQTLEETEINVRNAAIAFLKRENLRLHCYDRETGVYILTSGLHRMDWNVRRFEIGYWIDSRYSGKGYVTEAVEGITNFAFDVLDANRIEIRCDERNIKSRAVPERLNFKLEGILKNNALSPDKKAIINTCVYAKTK